MENIRVILVRPQLGQNIGSVARAMKNFGATKLRIVAPRDGWPNEKANELAVSAVDILNNAEVYATLEEATSDLNFLYGLTARDRFLNKKVISPSQFTDEEPFKKNYQIGLVFGPENNGLNNQDISLIDKIVTIPTSPEFSSLNIAQSAIIALYEIFQLNLASTSFNKSEHKPASSKEVTDLFEHLENTLSQRNFFKVAEKKEGMIINIRSIFKRIDNLSSQDVRTLRGIIKSLSGEKQD
jgi:tRNA/rRNA methyltransferase